MPRSKSKSKKGVHTIPQEDRRVIRNREQARKADAEKIKMASRRLKKEQRLNKQKVLSPASDNTDNQESFQHETSDEDSEFEEDTNLPQFSRTAIRSSNKLWKQYDAIKESKKTNLPPSSLNNPSTSRTIGQQINLKNDRKKGSKNIDLSSSPCIKPSASRTPGQQADQKNVSTKVSKKTGNDCTPAKEKSLIKPKSLVLKIPKNIIESQKLGSNFAETGQHRPKSYSDDKQLHGSDQTKMLEKTENKEIVGKGNRKPTKSKDFASNTLNIAPTKIHRKSTEDITNKINILQKKLKASETEMKSLDDQEKKLLPSVEEKKIAVSGDIKVRPADESVKVGDKKWLMCSCYVPDKRMIYIGDKNIKIAIHVNQGSQIVCNSRSRQETGLFQNENYSSDTVESQVIAKPDENKTQDTEKYNENTSNTECDSSSFSKFPSTNFQTVDGQAIDNWDTDTSIDSEYYVETATYTNSNLSSISYFSKENDSPGIKSRQEKLQEVCDVYLKEKKTILEKFESNFENCLKGKSISPKFKEKTS